MSLSKPSLSLSLSASLPFLNTINPSLPPWSASFLSSGLILANSLLHLLVHSFFQAPVSIFGICRWIESWNSGENSPLEPQTLFCDDGKVVSTVTSQHERLKFQAFPRRSPPKQALFTELRGCVPNAVTFLRFWTTTWGMVVSSKWSKTKLRRVKALHQPHQPVVKTLWQKAAFPWSSMVLLSMALSRNDWRKFCSLQITESWRS